jgi:hypothetical protein
MESFYHITDKTNYSRGWCYAHKIYSLSEEEVINCEVCKRIGRHPKYEFSVDVEGGKKFPDFLQCTAWPLLIVSQNVIDHWISEGISGFKYYSVSINNVTSPFQYYHVVVDGICDPDLEKMGLNIENQCINCSGLKFEKSFYFNKKFEIKKDTWDGKDLFTAKYFPRIYLCSSKVLRIAKKYKHTNCRIVLIEDARNSEIKSIV